MRFTAAVPWHQREKVPLNSILIVAVLLTMHPTPLALFSPLLSRGPMKRDAVPKAPRETSQATPAHQEVEARA